MKDGETYEVIEEEKEEQLEATNSDVSSIEISSIEADVATADTSASASASANADNYDNPSTTRQDVRF